MLTTSNGVGGVTLDNIFLTLMVRISISPWYPEIFRWMSLAFVQGKIQGAGVGLVLVSLSGRGHLAPLMPQPPHTRRLPILTLRCAKHVQFLSPGWGGVAQQGERDASELSTTLAD